MRVNAKVLAFLAVLSGPLLVSDHPARAADPTTRPVAADVRPAATGDFLRYADDGPAGGRLETADAVYINSSGAIVRLVAAVHIGEKSYYAGLARDFEKRDAVLYEMVKAKDVAPPGSLAPGEVREPSSSPVSEVQRFMKDALNLEFQLDQIDYTKPNFVHADLDAETFQRLQEERGETFQMLFIKQLLRALTQPDPQPNANANDPDKMLEDLIKTVTRPDPERQIKRVLAQQMTHMESDALGLGDPRSSVLIGERNKMAIATLKMTLAAGKKDIAVFYGAAHMPDLSAQLTDMGFKPVATEWRTAWNLAIRPEQPSAVESMMMQIVHGLDDGQP